RGVMRARTAPKYGRLYAFSAAETACPSGWHLPDEKEWDAMLAHFDIKPISPYGSGDGAQRRYSGSLETLLKVGNSGFGLVLGGSIDIDRGPRSRGLGDWGNYWSKNSRETLATGYSFSLTGGTPTPIFYTGYYDLGALIWKSSYAFA